MKTIALLLLLAGCSTNLEFRPPSVRDCFRKTDPQFVCGEGYELKGYMDEFGAKVGICCTD